GDQHPLVKALNNMNYKKVTVTLTNQQTLEIPAYKISNIEDTGRTVNVFLRNGDMIDIDLRYVVSMKCERRFGELSKIYDEAIGLLDDQEWDGTIKLLSELSKKDPKDYDVWYRLGIAQIRNNKPEDALHSIKKSIELNPFNPRSYLLKAKALQDMKKLDDAESCLREALTQFPNEIHLWMEMSSILHDKEEYDEAIEWQNKVVREEPENLEEWEYLASIADKKGDLSLAISAFTKVLELAPENSAIYKRGLEQLGCRYCRKGEVATATKTFNTLVEKFPEHVNGWDLLACVYRRTDKYDLAEKAVRKAIEINPDEASSWASLGYSIWRKDLKQAEEVCRKAVKMDPKNDFNWTALAKVLFVKNETKEGIKAVNKAEELGKDSGTNMYNIADGYATIKDSVKVLHYLRKALEIDKTQVALLKDDDTFDFIRENEEFKKLQEEYSR
ncbi:MAG: tetratricopeptide repeat protein, partial [Promethearchaeota archaeon]